MHARQRTHRHDIGTGWEEGGVSILWVVSHDDHIVWRGRVASVLDEELANVHCIVDASVQLMLRAIIVDTDNESLASRHFECG